jgi:Glycine-zipper domain
MRLTIQRLVGLALVPLVVGILSGPALAQGYVYPAKGQSPQQQQKDQADCHGWAMQQSGVNPAAMAPPPSGPTGQVARTAGRGAAVGAVGGAIGGNAGKGAAIGAATGALVGGMRRADQRRAAEQAQSQASAEYGRAYAACLEGRGYTVK